jgi:flagellar hook protein FlgE
MSSTFSIALSGLQAESEAINTTGNNLANLNTDGFKGSQVDFKTLFSEQLGGANGLDVGLGVAPPISNQLFSQGGIQTSTSPTAAAIQGNGFFVLSGTGGEQLLTRDGNFVFNADGVLQTETGENVQGWTATSTGLNAAGITGNITVPSTGTLPPVASTTFSLPTNLNSSGVVGDPTTGTFSTPVSVVDSLGDTHTLTATFTKTAANTWTYNVSIPSADVGGTAGTQTDLLTTPGTLTFNTDGTLASTSAGTVANPTAPQVLTIGTTVAAGGTAALADGAAGMSLNWNLFNGSGQGNISQYAEQSNVASPTVDGTPAANLTSVAIQNGGQVVATFSNGQTKIEAQIALASITNPTSLQNVGNNNFAVSGATATPAIGVPQTGGRGQVLGGAIEGSNVDLATQFTNLIVYQSAYQANTRVITTAQQMDQDLFQLIH